VTPHFTTRKHRLTSGSAHSSKCTTACVRRYNGEYVHRGLQSSADLHAVQLGCGVDLRSRLPGSRLRLLDQPALRLHLRVPRCRQVGLESQYMVVDLMLLMTDFLDPVFSPSDQCKRKLESLTLHVSYF
jgi:hypothetical protein